MNWLSAISELAGVGKVTAEKFNQLNIYTLRDLMFHFPFRYEDMQVRDIETILDGEKVTLSGEVVTPPVVNYYGGRKNRLTFRMRLDQSNLIQVSFFNQAYLAKQIEVGQTIAIYGKWQSDRQTLLGMRILKALNENDQFAAVYSTTKGLSQAQITKAIRHSFDLAKDAIVDLIPDPLNTKYHLLPLDKALYAMHFPKDEEEFKQAERKIIFLEFFQYQWKLQTALGQLKASSGVRLLYDNSELKQQIQSLPFELTAAQKQAVNEICYDLLAAYPMRRLLQGDVGSGKTVVAFIAMLAAVSAGFQSVLMVPTEILARQHLENFNRLFEGIGLQAVALVSAMPKATKDEVLQGLASGRIRLLIGTHALIQPSVKFKQLGLAVIDEQHRFGVNQRQILLEKGQEKEINILQMTATPIPRSLALTLYGDLSVSTIDESPKNRKAIITEIIANEQINSLYQKIQLELAKGHQVYYVLPLIDNSEKLQQVANVNNVMEELSKQLPGVTLASLHGQMDKQEQEAVMTAFKENHVQLLVATTMVEVGIDVPNATIMVIQSAERFGLAQLHQLRGRVGRSHHQSYCYLLANPTTEQGKQRLAMMEKERDGFLISQADLEIRGMGDLFGIAQSGLPQFRYANLYQDQVIHQVAKEEVTRILADLAYLSEDKIQQIDDWITAYQGQKAAN